MTIECPKLSPYEVDQYLRAAPISGSTMLEGFTVWLDGPQMCPGEYMFPVAQIEVDGSTYCFYPDDGKDCGPVSKGCGWTEAYKL